VVVADADNGFHGPCRIRPCLPAACDLAHTFCVVACRSSEKCYRSSDRPWHFRHSCLCCQQGHRGITCMYPFGANRLRGTTLWRKADGGFTLVALMVTIFVAAILMAIAVPSFKHITASSRLTTTANQFVDALNTARMEAIKRNAHTAFCGEDEINDDLGTSCGTEQLGAVFALTGNDNTVRVQSAPVISAASLQISTMNAIRFDARGLGHKGNSTTPYSGTVAVICTTAIDSDN